jgi:hypothetical protein
VADIDALRFAGGDRLQLSAMALGHPLHAGSPNVRANIVLRVAGGVEPLGKPASLLKWIVRRCRLWYFE